jgi:hypothetical protein
MLRKLHSSVFHVVYEILVAYEAIPDDLGLADTRAECVCGVWRQHRHRYFVDLEGDDRKYEWW